MCRCTDPLEVAKGTVSVYMSNFVHVNGFPRLLAEGFNNMSFFSMNGRAVPPYCAIWMPSHDLYEEAMYEFRMRVGSLTAFGINGKSCSLFLQLTLSLSIFLQPLAQSRNLSL